jgi:uncharacterized protein
MYAQEGKLTVQGTAIVRVEPDLASIAFAVSRTGPTPTDAFASVRKASEAVRAFLVTAASSQIRSSQIALHQDVPRPSTDPRELGYVATANFSLVLSALEEIEGLLAGIVSSGANRLTSVQFLTSKLKEVRAEARKKAVTAAKEKAALYCEAAGVELGPIVGVSENHFDPTQRQGGHVPAPLPATDVDERIGTFSPDSIPVGAGVTIVFKLK